jgi:homoaconitase/3-isopropylmalate dehydratase large subunit
VLKVELTRKLGMKVDVEDVVFTLLERGVHTDWGDAIVEFLGVPIERLSIDRKVKLCALTVHFGARAAFCPFDDVMRRHFGRLLRGRFPQSHPDRTAVYDGEHFLESRGVAAKVASDTGNAPSIESASNEIRGGVIIGPGALPYEIETVAGIVRGRRLAAEQPLLVCPATPELYRLSQRKGWTEAIVGAGGSVLDVSLYRHMGTDRLIDVAAESLGLVYCTRPMPHASNRERTRLASPRTAAEQLQLLF